MLSHFSFEVFGMVQGVFFRKYTVQKALELKIVGWVMNTHQGTVKGVCQGTKGHLNDMKRWLKSVGSPKSTIDRCEFRDEKTIDEIQFTNFEIRRNHVEEF